MRQDKESLIQALTDEREALSNTYYFERKNILEFATPSTLVNIIMTGDEVLKIELAWLEGDQNELVVEDNELSNIMIQFILENANIEKEIITNFLKYRL
jgi:hypothetical protein